MSNFATFNTYKSLDRFQTTKMLLDEKDFAPHPILAPLIYWFFQAYFKIVHWIYLAINFTRKREIVPKISDDLLLFPAVDLARMIWRKEVSGYF
jgi:hypothetical protein